MREGALIMLAGVLIALGAYAWATTGPAGDANIGAGLLFVGGAGLTLVGVAILLIEAVARRRS